MPISAIRSVHSVPKTVSSKLPRNASIHCLVASDLVLGRAKIPEWYQLVPTLADFVGCMPMSWPSELQELLPGEAMAIMRRHRDRYQRDWDMANAAFHSISEDMFLHAWYLGATRAFYYETDKTLKYPWHDRLAMLPLADLFNHSAKGCNAAFTSKSYTIVADRKYMAGSEVTTSYGEHSNDYLLAEYGFILDENDFDHVCLDTVIFPRLTEALRTELQRKEMLGEFLWRPGMKRTGKLWVAVRLLSGADTAVKGTWPALRQGKEDESGSLAKADELVQQLLAEYEPEAGDKLRHARAATAGSDYQRQTLVKRWDQIVAMLQQRN